MTARKMSISVPPEVEETIKVAAAQAGLPVSAWMAEAARQKAAHDAKLAEARAAAAELIAEYEAEHGPTPERIRAESRQALDRFGIFEDTQQAVS